MATPPEGSRRAALPGPVPAESSVDRYLPADLARIRPGHVLTAAAALWGHRANLGYASRLLTGSACDSCGLGASGLGDHVLPGLHTCLRRLDQLEVHTHEALAPADLMDVSRLRSLTGRELRELGRLPYPFVRRARERGFSRVSWEEAIALAGDALRDAAPERVGWLAGSRGLTMEAGFALRRTATALGGSAALLSRRVVSAGALALRATTGSALPPGSLSDLVSAELILVLGANLAGQSPVALKYLHAARQRGARVVWIGPNAPVGPVDDHFAVTRGGDRALIAALLQRLLQIDAIDHAYLTRHTTGIDELRQAVDQVPMDRLLERCGVGWAEVRWLATLVSRATRLSSLWSTGLSRQRGSVATLRSVLDLHLLRGAIGRPGCAVLPLEAPAGIWSAVAAGLEPDHRAEELLERAASDGLDAMVSTGACLWDDADRRGLMQRATHRTRVRVHLARFVDRGCLRSPAELVLLLPSLGLHEHPGGASICSVERRVRYTPVQPGHPWLGEARSEWQILGRLAAAARPTGAPGAQFETIAALREAMHAEGGSLRGMSHLRQPGDFYQIGPTQLHRSGYPTEDRRARFAATAPLEPLG